jgi:hypothetical protein
MRYRVHPILGVDFGGLSVYPSGASEASSEDSALGFRGQAGLTLSGSSSDSSYGLRLELSVQRSGTLHILGADTTAMGWLVTLQPFYGAF